jgi:hypothetical protein
MIPNTVKMKFLPVTLSTVPEKSWIWRSPYDDRDTERGEVYWLFILGLYMIPTAFISQTAFISHRLPSKYTDSHIPCRVAKDLDCVVPIWFTKCDRVWFTHAMPRPWRAPTMPFWQRLFKATAQHSRGTAPARHGICELISAVSRRAVGSLPRFDFFRLLSGHSRSLLTRTLLSFGVCLIVLMMMETADYTEYKLTLNLKPVFFLLLCYVSTVFSSFDSLQATTL